MPSVFLYRTFFSVDRNNFSEYDFGELVSRHFILKESMILIKWNNF